MSESPARRRDDTDGALHFDPPELIDLAGVSGQCGVAGCSDETISLRWEASWLGEYLEVCKRHRSATWDIK